MESFIKGSSKILINSIPYIIPKQYIFISKLYYDIISEKKIKITWRFFLPKTFYFFLTPESNGIEIRNWLLKEVSHPLCSIRKRNELEF